MRSGWCKEVSPIRSLGDRTLLLDSIDILVKVDVACLEILEKRSEIVTQAAAIGGGWTRAANCKCSHTPEITHNA